MVNVADWEKDIPLQSGELPGGGVLRRTDPSGKGHSKVAFLGVYPAATSVRQFKVGDNRLNLPVEVEAVSFEAASQSGAEFEKHYVDCLGLTRTDVMATDMMPYYFANTTMKDGRSMADNVEKFEADRGKKTGIKRRPPPGELVRLARAMPGNVDRLTDYFNRFSPRLLLTLGTEAAAFVLGIEYTEAKAKVEDLLYAAPVRIEFLGVSLVVVHLAHPHHFIKKTEKWMTRQSAWCVESGRTLVKSI